MLRAADVELKEALSKPFSTRRKCKTLIEAQFPYILLDRFLTVTRPPVEIPAKPPSITTLVVKLDDSFLPRVRRSVSDELLEIHSLRLAHAFFPQFNEGAQMNLGDILSAYTGLEEYKEHLKTLKDLHSAAKAALALEAPSVVSGAAGDDEGRSAIGVAGGQLAKGKGRSVEVYPSEVVWHKLVSPGVASQRQEKVSRVDYRLYVMALIINCFLEVLTVCSCAPLKPNRFFFRVVSK